jgi:hypothetical protein
LIRPPEWVTSEQYNRLFTLHGVTMVWFFLIPSIPTVLGNFLIPLMMIPYKRIGAFYNLPGLAEPAMAMKSLGDAIALPNRLIEHLEEAGTECAGQIP